MSQKMLPQLSLLEKGTEYASKAFGSSPEAIDIEEQRLKNASEDAISRARIENPGISADELKEIGDAAAAAERLEVLADPSNSFYDVYDEARAAGKTHEQAQALATAAQNTTTAAATATLPTGVETLTTTGEALSLPDSGGISSIPTDIIAPTATAITTDVSDIEQANKIIAEGQRLSNKAVEKPSDTGVVEEVTVKGVPSGFSASGEPIFDPSSIVTSGIQSLNPALDASVDQQMTDKIKREADVVVEEARPDL